MNNADITNILYYKADITEEQAIKTLETEIAQAEKRMGELHYRKLEHEIREKEQKLEILYKRKREEERKYWHHVTGGEHQTDPSAENVRPDGFLHPQRRNAVAADHLKNDALDARRSVQIQAIRKVKK